jgi:hypothetical protein
MLNPIRRGALALPVLLAGAGAAPATELAVPGDYASITEALAAAKWGDMILVAPGNYKESLVLSEDAGDGVILRATEGPELTTIAYGETANVNEAVVTFQRCSNSTQLIGFSIDGRGIARRGVLVNSESRPVLSGLIISGAEYGVASHRGSYPYIENTTITGTTTAALFVQGGSADASDCTFAGGEKFGVYVRGTLDPMRLRDCTVANNGQVGLQATEGEFSVEGGLFANNGDSGIILQDVSPEIRGVTVENHPNVGIVMEACWGIVEDCIIRNNEYGVVVSIEGQPEIYHCTFRDNRSYHVGIEGDGDPVIGGSLERANEFLGEPAYAVSSSSSQRVNATYNFWDKPCVPKEIFQNTGEGKLIRKPWASGNRLRSFDNCETSRKYHTRWINGKLDDQGNPIGRGDRVSSFRGDRPEADAASSGAGG